MADLVQAFTDWLASPLNLLLFVVVLVVIMVLILWVRMRRLRGESAWAHKGGEEELRKYRKRF